MYFLRYLVTILSVSAANLAHGQVSCFLHAEGYYEQIYCEVKAEGRGDGLPTLFDFKKNNAMTQALLLKRPATKAGIKLAMPKQNQRINKPQIKPRQQPSVPKQKGMKSCQLSDSTIGCQSEIYQLAGNKANKYLAAKALSETNKMSLPLYQGNLNKKSALNYYLTDAYRLYIEKMLVIGLGGATMSYSKFGYVFNDLAEKNVPFSERFEKMYGFLKKDKRTINVSQKIVSDKLLTLNDCAGLSDELIICERSGKNYIYQRQTSVSSAAR